MIKLRKKYLFFVLFIFSSIILYSQTWKEKSGFGSNNFTEWTVISKEQWDRLRLQRIENRNYALLLYTDSFEMEMGGVNEVVSGTRPIFNGYYYLYGKWNYYGGGGWDLVLAYGNSNTGRMEIKFANGYNHWSNPIETNSNEYRTLYSRFLRRVNGE